MPGTDFMVQAYSGIAEKIGRCSGLVGGSLFTVLDVLGGVVASQGICAALLGQHMNHAGIRVESSLLGAATLLCADDPQVHPDGAAGLRGSASVLKGVYATRQGSIAIECCDAATAARLAEACCLAGRPDLAAHLGEALARRTAAHWADVFEGCGIPAAIVVEDLALLPADPRIGSCLGRGAYTQVHSPWRFA